MVFVTLSSKGNGGGGIGVSSPALRLLVAILALVALQASAAPPVGKTIKIGENNGKGGKNVDVSALGPPWNCNNFGGSIEVDGLPGKGNAKTKSVFKKRSCAGSKWTGDDETGDTFTMVVSRGKSGKGEIVTGSIVSVKDQVVHQIRPTADGGTTLVTTPAEDFPPEKDPIGDDGGANRKLRYNKSPNLAGHAMTRNLQDDTPEIRVLVLWTEASECAASSLASGCTVTDTTEDNMVALIELAVEETNDAFVASGVNARLALAHAYRDPDNYVENDTSAVDGNDAFENALNALNSNGDGELDTAHTLRETYAADAVALIIDDPDWCGLARLPWPVGTVPTADRMFSVTRWDCATGYFSFGHEIAHNLGCRHDRGVMNDCDLEANPETYYGFRDVDGDFRSIMAYSCKTTQCDENPSNGCVRVQRFSFPGNYVTGGTDMGAIGDENNNCAGQINAVAASVAAFYGVPTCGNGEINDGEQCDLANLNGESCESLGLGNGILGCNTDCSFDTSLCGSTPSAPLDILFIVDTSGSYRDDLPIFKTEAPTIMSNIQTENPDSRFAVVTFEDYPVSPYGRSGDLPYRKNLDFTSDLSTVTTVISGLTTQSGGDFAESQLTAIYESIEGSDPVSFRGEAVKIIMLWTDATFHRGEDEPGYPGPTTYEVLNALENLASSRRRSRELVAEGDEDCDPFCAEPLPPPPSWPVRFVGVDRGQNPAVLASLAQLAEFTGTLAGPEGVDCDGDGVIDLLEGEPIVCAGVSGVSLGATIETVISESVATLAPIAKCKDIDTTTDEGVCHATGVSVDDGSYDPNPPGTAVFDVVQVPDASSQFVIGSTPVNLVAVNSYGLTDACNAIVTVRDNEDPTLDCNLPEGGVSPNDAPIWIEAKASDNCGIQSITVKDIVCSKVNEKNGKESTIPCSFTLASNGAFSIDHSRGVGTVWRWTIEAIDASANVQSKDCEMVIQRPGN